MAAIVALGASVMARDTFRAISAQPIIPNRTTVSVILEVLICGGQSKKAGAAVSVD